MPENAEKSDIQGTRPRVSEASDGAGEGRKVGPVIGGKERPQQLVKVRRQGWSKDFPHRGKSLVGGSGPEHSGWEA